MIPVCVGCNNLLANVYAIVAFTTTVKVTVTQEVTNFASPSVPICADCCVKMVADLKRIDDMKERENVEHNDN